MLLFIYWSVYTFLHSFLIMPVLVLQSKEHGFKNKYIEAVFHFKAQILELSFLCKHVLLWSPLGFYQEAIIVCVPSLFLHKRKIYKKIKTKPLSLNPTMLLEVCDTFLLSWGREPSAHHLLASCSIQSPFNYKLVFPHHNPPSG